MTAPAYELIDRYLWINAAASSIELTENELLSISQIADNVLYEPLLDFNSITDRETADRTVAKILSRLDNPHLSANFDNYLNEYIRLKKMGSQNKIIETMTYYIYEFSGSPKFILTAAFLPRHRICTPFMKTIFSRCCRKFPTGPKLPVTARRLPLPISNFLGIAACAPISFRMRP